MALGDALLAGQNVPQNAAEAGKWFRRAAEASADTTIFKSQRTRPVPHTETSEVHSSGTGVRTPKLWVDDPPSA